MKVECDICNKMAVCNMIIMYGIETMACDECLGREDDQSKESK